VLLELKVAALASISPFSFLPITTPWCFVLPD
jgi:hypothetical protein